MKFKWLSSIWQSESHWLRRVYYVTGLVFVIAFTGWLVAASLYYQVSRTVTLTPTVALGEMGLTLWGVLIQLVAGFLAVKLGHRFITIKLLTKWVKNINNRKGDFRHIFWPEKSGPRWPLDRVKGLLMNKENLKRLLEERKHEEASRLNDELTTLVDKVREEGSELPWHDISKLLYKVGRLCDELKNSELAGSIQQPYGVVRSIINSITCISLARMSLSLLWFTIGFLMLNGFSIWRFGRQVGLDWLVPVMLMVGGIFITSLLFVGLQWSIRWFTEKTWTDLDDIIVGILSGPLSATIIAAATYFSLQALPEYFKSYARNAGDLLLRDIPIHIFTILVGAWIVVFIFDRVVIYVLGKWAEKTEQKYDDMFVRIAQLFGDFVIVVIAIGLILVTFQPQLKEATGVDNILMPYAIVVSVFSVILGYTSREAIENFFSGVLLQIDKPFEKGERLLLETGEICDVRDIGMRSTILYNVLENSEVSIPNNLMVAQKITNISRPDWELRIPVKLAIQHDGYSLWRAELILLDIAYLEGEVDEARITNAELTPELEARSRESIREKLLSLVTIYPHIQKATIPQIIGGYVAKRECIFALDPARGLEQFDLPEEDSQKISVLFSRWCSGNALSEEEMETLLQDLRPGEGEIFRRLERINELRKRYVAQLEESRIQAGELMADRTDLDVGFTPTRLQKLIEEIVHGIILRDEVEHARPEERLESILYEMVQREVIFRGMTGETRSEHIAKNVEFLHQSIMKLASRVALKSEDERGTSSDPLQAIKAIAQYFKAQEDMRLGLLTRIQEDLTWVADALFTIGDTFRKDVRREMDVLIAEMGKEPTVHSQFVVSEEGRGYVAIDFNVYATHLERRFEVINKINREIQRRFRAAGINLQDLCS